MTKMAKQPTKTTTQAVEKEKKPYSKRLKDHDILVRGIYSFKEFVLKILNYTIPENIKPFIDFSTLQPLPDTHVNTKLEISQSDTIYEAALNENVLSEAARADKKRPSFRFCFLGEFKSSRPNEPIDFQIEDYVRSIRRDDLRNGRTPSIVLPFLLYHGPVAWKNKRLHDIYSPYFPQTVLDYIAYPRYIVIDLQAMSDELIKNNTDLGELRAAFLALKHAQEKDFFIANMGEMLKFVEITPASFLLQEYLSMLMTYFQRRSRLDSEKFNEIVEQSKTNSDMVKEANGWKIYLQRTEQKGFDEGVALSRREIDEANRKAEEERLKAEQERLKTEQANKKAVLGFIQNTRFKDAQIADILGLPIVFVESIRKELKKTLKSTKKTKAVSPPQ